jgi:hypothetical protein
MTNYSLESRRAFWDRQAASRSAYLPAERLSAISEFLRERVGKRNLDLGGGLFSYVLGSVALDISERSIKKNLSDTRGAVVFDLCDTGREVEGKMLSLPFESRTFDSATAVGLWPYLPRETGIQVLKDLRRVLLPDADFYIAGSIMHFAGQVVSDTSASRIAAGIRNAGYDVCVETVDTSHTTSSPLIRAVCVRMPKR